jgi:hypothetical protein
MRTDTEKTYEICTYMLALLVIDTLETDECWNLIASNHTVR